MNEGRHSGPFGGVSTRLAVHCYRWMRVGAVLHAVTGHGRWRRCARHTAVSAAGSARDGQAELPSLALAWGFVCVCVLCLLLLLLHSH